MFNHRSATLLLFLSCCSSCIIDGVEATNPYFSLGASSLPPRNASVASGNPFRGFCTSPDWTSPQDQLDSLPASLDYYYVGLNRVMEGPQSFTGLDTYLEPKIQQSAARGRHVILRFILDYPGDPTNVPDYLVDAGLEFNEYSAYGGGMSPDYNDALLVDALLLFIAELGRRYDGDTRIAFLQAGLLGFWGEWHTYTNRDNDWIPESLKEAVIDAFDSAFDVTPIQIRYAHEYAVGRAGFGLHDDSFAHSTLDGAANAGVEVDWFFWPTVLADGDPYFWRLGPMGGEVRPDLQDIIFSDSYYPAGTQVYQQDFNLCVQTTHASYMLNYYAFDWPGYTGTALDRAIAAADGMGYSFVVTEVSAVVGSDAPLSVIISVTVEQTGVAPFYYPLSLVLACDQLETSVAGLQQLRNEGESASITFPEIPATLDCLNSITIRLDSDHAYSANPIRFAQGNTGEIRLSIPMPPIAPTEPPTPEPTDSPTPEPTESPTPEPTDSPTPEPTESPTPEPTEPGTTCSLAIGEACTSSSQCCSGRCTGFCVRRAGNNKNGRKRSKRRRRSDRRGLRG